VATDLGEHTVQVTTSATKITASTLQQIIEALIRNRGSIRHGEQNLQKLNLQKKQLESVNISGADLKGFRKQLNQHGVDFSIMRDKNGQHIVFFKAQDINRVYLGLEKHMQGLKLDRNSRKPIKEVIESAVQRAAAQAQQHKSQEKSKVANRGGREM